MTLFFVVETVKFVFGFWLYCMIGGTGFNWYITHFEIFDPRFGQGMALAFGAFIVGYGMALITFHRYLNAIAAKLAELAG